MKRLFTILVLTVAAFVLTYSNANAQCKQQVEYQCSEAEPGSPAATTYLRSFNTKMRLDASGQSGQKWSQVLNKGIHYRFKLCVPDGLQDEVILTLFDGTHPELSNPYGSTFDKTTQKDRAYFDFICNRGGLYYISIRFKNGKGSKKGCAVCSLSMIGKKR